MPRQIVRNRATFRSGPPPGALARDSDDAATDTVVSRVCRWRGTVFTMSPCPVLPVRRRAGTQSSVAVPESRCGCVGGTEERAPERKVTSATTDSPEWRASEARYFATPNVFAPDEAVMGRVTRILFSLWFAVTGWWLMRRS
jgi:hypothetical protein